MRNKHVKTKITFSCRWRLCRMWSLTSSSVSFCRDMIKGLRLNDTPAAEWVCHKSGPGPSQSCSVWSISDKVTRPGLIRPGQICHIHWGMEWAYGRLKPWPIACVWALSQSPTLPLTRLYLVLANEMSSWSPGVHILRPMGSIFLRAATIKEVWTE